MGLEESEGGRVTGGASSKGRAHILMILLEEQGHYTVFLQLLYRLREFDITVTFCSSERRVKQLQELLSAGEFNSLDLRLVRLSDDVSQTADKPGAIPPIVLFARAVKAQLEPYRKTLASETNPEAKPTCLLSDSLLNWSEELAEELQIPRYLLFTTAGWSVYTVLKAKIEAAKQTGTPTDIVEVPGQFSAPAKDAPSMIYPMLNLRNLAGMLVNTFEELEGEELVAAIRTELPHMTTKPGCKVAKFLPIGPLMHTPGYSKLMKEDSDPQSKALEWLDAQPPKSVLYIAFGTMANIPLPLVLELARGLELSGVPFLWVLRLPKSDRDKLSSILPPTFQDCVKTRGFLQMDWGPQLQILQHPSVGGLLSHCGWNSAIESISLGVPILTWHLHGDQGMNARFLVEALKVGLPVRKPGSDAPVVPGEEVAAAVKALMVDGTKGEEFRQNCERLKELGVVAMQEGGSSRRNLDEFVKDILTH